MITVGDVLALPVFDSVRLASPCEGYLSRPVVNAGIIDEEPLESGYDDAFPHEFILSSLGFARRDAELADRAVASIIECDVAALAIKSAAWDSVGPQAAALSQSRGVPVFLYEGQYYEQILSSVLTLIRMDEEQSNKGQLIDALFAEREPADIRAAMYNISRATGATVQCVAVSPADGDECSLYATLSALSSVLVSFRSDWGSVETAYACRYHDCALAFVSYARPPIDGVSRSEPDLVKRIEGTGRVRCGISEELPLGEGDLAVRQACAALTHARKADAGTARWADLGSESFRVAARADRLFSRTCDLHRRELEAYDRANDADMLATARAFAHAFGDVRTTSEMLYQHPNTVRYRLRKLKSLFGMMESSDRELAHFLALVFLNDSE